MTAPGTPTPPRHARLPVPPPGLTAGRLLVVRGIRVRGSPGQAFGIHAGQLCRPGRQGATTSVRWPTRTTHTRDWPGSRSPNARSCGARSGRPCTGSARFPTSWLGRPRPHGCHDRATLRRDRTRPRRAPHPAQRRRGCPLRSGRRRPGGPRAEEVPAAGHDRKPDREPAAVRAGAIPVPGRPDRAGVARPARRDRYPGLPAAVRRLLGSQRDGLPAAGTNPSAPLRGPPTWCAWGSRDANCWPRTTCPCRCPTSRPRSAVPSSGVRPAWTRRWPSRVRRRRSSGDRGLAPGTRARPGTHRGLDGLGPPPRGRSRRHLNRDRRETSTRAGPCRGIGRDGIGPDPTRGTFRGAVRWSLVQVIETAPDVTPPSYRSGHELDPRPPPVSRDGAPPVPSAAAGFSWRVCSGPSGDTEPTSDRAGAWVGGPHRPSEPTSSSIRLAGRRDPLANCGRIMQGRITGSGRASGRDLRRPARRAAGRCEGVGHEPQLRRRTSTTCWHARPSPLVMGGPGAGVDSLRGRGGDR